MKVVKKQRNSKSCIICGMDNPSSVKAMFYEMENGELRGLFTSETNTKATLGAYMAE